MHTRFCTLHVYAYVCSHLASFLYLSDMTFLWWCHPQKGFSSMKQKLPVLGQQGHKNETSLSKLPRASWSPSTGCLLPLSGQAHVTQPRGSTVTSSNYPGWKWSQGPHPEKRQATVGAKKQPPTEPVHGASCLAPAECSLHSRYMEQGCLLNSQQKSSYQLLNDLRSTLLTQMGLFI